MTPPTPNPTTPRARGRPPIGKAAMVLAPKAYMPAAAREFFEQLGGGNYAAGLRAAWVILSAPAEKEPPYWEKSPERKE